MTKGHFYHSSFTPSQADPETLEALLVGRSELAQRLVERICDSATGARKHQDLLIGPRGIGKTHLLSLVYHRVKAVEALADKLAIAWLPEDPYMTGYTDLILEILRALAREYPVGDLNTRITRAREHTSLDLIETALEQTLLTWLGEKTLLILVENLQDLFRDIGESGQEKLRALIQNSGHISILATSTSLFDAVAKRSKMFYGFFRQTDLRPLNALEARGLLVRLAQLDADAQLEAQLRSPLGLARVRVMHLLAGGNPRVCTLFYEFLTRDSVDTLLGPFMQLIDKLMPYYQGLMRVLSAQQRRIVEAFCRAQGPLSASRLAEELHAKPQTVSTQIRRLQELGYLSQVDHVARSTLFELREPLMRYTIQSKEDRGAYLGLIIDFLRFWYSPAELEERAALAQSEQERRYLTQAALLSAREGDPIESALRSDFLSASVSGDHEAALQALNLRLVRNGKDIDALETKARILAYQLQQSREALQCLIKVTEIDPARSVAWVERGGMHFEVNEIKEAIAATQTAVEVKPHDPAILRLLAWYLSCDNRQEEARTLIEQAIAASGTPKTAEDWDQRGTDLIQAERHQEALSARIEALYLKPDFLPAWSHLLGLLQHDFWRPDLGAKLSDVSLQVASREKVLHVYHAIFQGLILSETKVIAELASIEAGNASFAKSNLQFLLTKANAQMYLGKSEEALECLESFSQPKDRHEIIELESALALLYAALNRWEAFQISVGKLLTGRPVRPQEIRGSPLAAIRVSARNRWRESISHWIKAFEQCDQLALLAAKLCLDAKYLVSEKLEPTAAEAWLEEFRAEAQPYPELQLPVRIFSFVLAYRKNPDPALILTLPPEERILLEPGLAESLASRPTQLDRQIETFIANLEVRAQRYKEAQAKKAYWKNPAPLTTSVLANLQIASNAESADVFAKPLLPGGWAEIQRDEAGRLLKMCANENETIRKVLARPGISVTRIRQRPLVTSELLLYQIDLLEAGQYGAIDILHGSGQSHLLDGQSNVLHELVAKNALKTNSAEERAEFITLFCSSVRGEDGRFRIFFSDDIENIEESQWEGMDSNIALKLMRELDDGKTEYQALMHYSNLLFKSVLRLPHAGNSFVEMVEDETIKELGYLEEVFDGPIRWVWRKPRESEQPPIAVLGASE